MKTQLIKFNGDGKLLYTPVKGVQGVHIYLDFFAGSLNDPKGKLGVAHFCEHILAGFDTTNLKKEERCSLVRKFQGFNASTSREMMRFYIYTVKNHFMEALDLLTDPFANVVIEKTDFERERKVILDEVATRIKTNGREANNLYNTQAVKEAHYNNQIESPAGTCETVEKITIKDIRSFMEKYFTLSNLIITVAGNISKKEVMKGIKKFIIPRIKEKGEVGFRPRDLKKDIMCGPKMMIGQCMEKDKAYIEFNYKVDYQPFTGKIEDTDYCRAILSSCLSEIIFKKLRLDNGLCYACSSRVKSAHRLRRLEDIIECAQGSLDRIIEEYLKHLQALPKDLDKAQFEKFKQKICESENYDIDRLFQIANGALEAYDMFEILNYDKVKEYDMKRFSSVKYEEVNSLYKSLFKNLPQIMLFSSDEKHHTKEFERQLYSKLKEILKEKNK